MTPEAAAAAITGLLSNIVGEGRARDADAWDQFRLKLDSGRHKQLVELIDSNHLLASEIKQLLKRNHDELQQSIDSVISSDELIEKIERLVEENASKDDLFDASMITTATANHKRIHTPNTFPNVESELTDNSAKRLASWPPFINASCALVTFEVTNHTKFPIHEVSLNIEWNDRTYNLHNILKLNQNYERVSKYYYQIKGGTTKLSDYEDKPEWIMRRFESEILKIPQIHPFTTHELQLQRVTSKYFHKKPKLTLTFKDNFGKGWQRLDNEPPKQVS